MFDHRANGDMWALANEYLTWFADEYHWLPDQVYDLPWVALVRFTLRADDVLEARRTAANQPRRAMRRMT